MSMEQLAVISNQSLYRFLRCAAVLANLVGLGALSSACAVDDPAPRGTAPASERVAKAQAALAGVDGSVTVEAAGTVVNRYTALAADAALNATSIQVASAAALSVGGDALAPGDLLLIAQMQGATISTAADDATWGQVTALNGAGLYELVEVLAVTNNVITLACGLKHAYATAGQTQVVRVPQYDTLTVATGASITAPAWNGTVGGVVAVHAKNTVTLTGNIDVSALGFRGGIPDNASDDAGIDVAIFASKSQDAGARKGEGIAGQRLEFGRAPAANGGGGGNSHNGGGGGGANARSGAAWNGQGIFDLTVKGGATAWPLDPGFAKGSSEGGGRGGYTYSSSDLNATTSAPGKAGWGGNNRRERGGLGGRPVDNDPTERVFFGGGGGAGDANNDHGGRGGNGGGMVILVAGSVAGKGQILANGEAGVNADSVSSGSKSGDAPGGGGGGGTVVVRASTVTGIAVQARGGTGGSQLINNGDEGEGPGGGGGGGFVSISDTVTADVAGGKGGTTNSAALTEFPTNGATGGSGGKSEFGAALGAVPYCSDTTAPDTAIDSGPKGTVATKAGTFTFSSPDAGTTFECSLDGGAFAACTTPFSTGTLADGSHTFQVRAKDGVGNVDASPASRTWTVDTAPPETTIESGPSGPTADPTPQFAFSSVGGVSFECAIDAGAFAACTTPHTTAALADGAHTFRVRAIDAAGNVDASPATRAFTVDATAPETTIESGPSGPTADSTPQFTFSSVDGVSFECAVDAGAFAACTSPHITASLADGAHTFRVRAIDALGNVDATPATRAFTVDTTGPDTAIDSGPSGPTADSTPQFTFSSVDGVSFQCAVDAGAFAACTTPHTTAALADGAHTFRVRAVDALGNVDASPATRAFTVDTTGPETSIDTGPSGATADSTPEFTFSSVDGVSFQCAVDAGAFVACTTPHITAALADGAHTFRVRAIDALGNVDATPATRAFTVDTAVPDSDGDGLDDGEEDAIGTSKTDADSDDDGVPDGDEPDPGVDTDGDGLVNALDPDSDNDGLFDGTELGLDCASPGTDVTRGLCVADADGGATKTLPLDADTDGGGVRDGAEDHNLNGRLDAGETDPTAGNGDDDDENVDTDDDGLSDATEGTLHSDPNDADTDDDGVPDGLEPNPSADGDGDGLIDVLDVDSDNDGLFDGTELGRDCVSRGTDATRGHCRADEDLNTKTSAVDPDSDGGGVIDGSEDTNLDGKLDAGEGNPIAGQGADDGSIDDSDGDGISDATETEIGSDPDDADSDDDGLLDGLEPNFSDDNDRDGLINVLDSDADDDGLFDGTEAGKPCSDADTDSTKGQCTADADQGATITRGLIPDTDRGGVDDGEEDTNLDGAVGSGERNPLDAADDGPAGGEGGAGGGTGTAGEAGASTGGTPTGGGGEASGGAAGEAGAGGAAGAGTAGTGGTAAATGGSGTGGTNATGGTSTGGSGAGGSSGTGGSNGGVSSGGSAATSGAPADDKTVILGGGLCAYRPAPSANTSALLAAAGLALTFVRRRRNRR